MNIITKGLGQKATLITRGYGFSALVKVSVEYFVSAIVRVREYTTALISGRRL